MTSRAHDCQSAAGTCAYVPLYHFNSIVWFKGGKTFTIEHRIPHTYIIFFLSCFVYMRYKHTPTMRDVPSTMHARAAVIHAV